MIRYFINKEIDSKVNQWAIEFLLSSAGFKSVKTNILKTDVNLYYGNDDKELEIATKALIIKNETKIIFQEKNIDLSVLINENKIDFDIISATKLFLTDEIHANLESTVFDIHHRLKFNSSFQHKKGIGNTPIVNYYVRLLSNCIEKKFNLNPTPLLPKNYKSVLILSHDVDEPFRYAIIKNFTKRFQSISLKNKIKYCWLSIRKKLRSIIFNGHESYLNFEKIMETEGQYGFNSTFFFSSKTKFDKSSHFKHDNSYDISWKEFEIIFDKINKRGFEIGLHSSYNSQIETTFFKLEKERLENFSKRNILGNRHHFWNLGSKPENTLLKHQQVGLQYDSSIAFNDSPGFRNNVALPYYPFNSQKNEPITTLQIPNFIMDTNLIKESINEEAILENAIKLIENLEKSKGVASINWHVRMAFPNDPKLAIYGKIYIEILNYLSKKEDIWVTSFENYYNWFKKRENIINEQ